MAVPILGAARTTHTSAANNASTLDPAQSLGGVHIDGGDYSLVEANPAVSTRISQGRQKLGMRGVQLNESADGAFHTKRAAGAGVFAYGGLSAAGKYIMIGGGSEQGTIGGVASSVLNNSGANAQRNAIHFKVAQLGASLLDAHRLGYWRANGVNIGSGTPQRHNWTTYPASLTNTYHAALGSGDVDVAARPSRAIPGYLFMLIDRTDWSQASSGISEAFPVDTGNFVQYAAKTG